MAKQRTPSTDQDGGWKQIVEALFREFLLFFFPHVYVAVDFGRPVDHLEQELRSLFSSSDTSRRIADKLVRVSWKGRGELLLLIHIEIQGQPQSDFAERMHTYYYRLVDRFRLPVTSLAILADANPRFRPSRFVREAPGTRMVLDFSVVKLLDFKTESELRANPSPFALASLIQLKKLEVGSDSERLLAGKLEMARAMFQRGYSVDHVRSLYRFLDYIMRLPPELEQAFERDLAREGETAMTYLSGIEKRAWKRGREEGEAVMLLRLIERKFGVVTEDTRRLIEAGDSEQLLEWGERILTATDISDVFG